MVEKLAKWVAKLQETGKLPPLSMLCTLTCHKRLYHAKLSTYNLPIYMAVSEFNKNYKKLTCTTRYMVDLLNMHMDLTS